MTPTSRHAIAREKNIGVWYACRAEGRTHPRYRHLCAQLYNDCHWQVRTMIEEVIKQVGHEDVDARQVTVALTAMTDGMWLDLQIQPRDFAREEARKPIEMFLGKVSPVGFGGRK